MKKRLLSLGIAVVMSISVFVGCGKEENKESSNTSSISSTSATTSVQTSNDNATKKNNLETMLELMKEAKKKVGVMGFGQFLAEFDLQYKGNIVNPINKSTDIYAIDKYHTILSKTDTSLDKYAASLVAIVNMPFDKLDKSKMTYGCNPKNKGVVIAFVFFDRFYLYEVDENGNKVNETTYMFPEGE
ncbi:MAG: hypothetical protein N3B21_00360 [Clostridia bacterium]|nr:hypothetical protein [Clostridia bacterium]